MSLIAHIHRAHTRICHLLGCAPADEHPECPIHSDTERARDFDACCPSSHGIDPTQRAELVRRHDRGPR